MIQAKINHVVSNGGARGFSTLKLGFQGSNEEGFFYVPW